MSKRRPEDLVKLAESQAWQVKRTKRSWKLYPPDPDKEIVILPLTPSDHRWWNNAVTQLKRSGLDI